MPVDNLHLWNLNMPDDLLHVWSVHVPHTVFDMGYNLLLHLLLHRSCVRLHWSRVLHLHWSRVSLHWGRICLHWSCVGGRCSVILSVWCSVCGRCFIGGRS